MSDFISRYQQLNHEQKIAVDTLEGPVMVIAGAGTGKTQTIALRIANILEKTQTPPSSILCLTFTDSAAFNMRQRLLSIIGPAAYQVKVHTFHSFCNEVIADYPDYFIFAPDVKVADELEKIDIIKKLTDSLSDGSILKPWGDRYYYCREIQSKIQSLKRENITPDIFQNLIDAEKYFIEKSMEIYSQLKALRLQKDLEFDLLKLVSLLQNIPNLSTPILAQLNYFLNLYRNGGFAVGAAKSPAINFKNSLLNLIDDFQKNIPKQQQLLEIYQGYQAYLSGHGLYDFDDMILFVLNAFRRDTDLLRNYQEKFQYILVDEYQDTNSAQNEIVELIGSFYDNPNIFVVGDDDQSIFRFQGASIENLHHFINKYHIAPIVLHNNYRSHQLILDTADSVITNNKNRLGSLVKNVDKQLISQQKYDPDPVNLTIAPSPLEESYLVASKIQELISCGTSPGEIAVLYHNNNDNVELVEVLNRLKIKFYLASDQDILKSKIIIQLINLLKYIDNPADQTLLFPLLSSEFINFDPLDLLHLLRHEPVSLRSERKLKKFNLRLAKAQIRLRRYNLDKFFNITIRKFKFLKYCLQSQNPNLLNQLYLFYSELKRLSLEQNFNLSQFLNRLDRLAENKISLSLPPLADDLANSIQLMTVHKAKGLEFEHVFLIQVVDKKWGNSADRSSIQLPPGIIRTEISQNLTDPNEDERRLFYVALTRAKKQIYISYFSQNNAGKDVLPSVFLSEINPKLIQSIHPSPDSHSESLSVIFSPLASSTPSLNNYLKKYLTSDYIFNITHLNSYLRCPFCFYHNTILRVPQSKDKFSSFGTAIHAALSDAYLLKDGVYDKFVSTLRREQLPQDDYQESLTKGKILLDDYLKNYPINPDLKRLVDVDFKHDHVHLDDIPITGKIDLINIIRRDEIEVVDFKTGNPDGKYKELSPDGDYFRQLVFYKLLITLDPNFKYIVQKGTIDFVEKSKQRNVFIRKEFDITPDHLESLKVLIKTVYQKILNLEFFEIGENCKNKHNLHYLLKTQSQSFL